MNGRPGRGLLGPVAGIDPATDISVTYKVDGVPGIFDAPVTLMPEPSGLALAALGRMDLLAFA